MTIKFSEVTNIELDGVDMKDYPDFCDAYISEARFADTKQPLTDEQLCELQEQNPDAFFEAVNDECLSIADRYYS